VIYHLVDGKSSKKNPDFWLSIIILVGCIVGSVVLSIAFPVLWEGEYPPITAVVMLLMIGGVLLMWFVTNGQYLSKYSGG